MKEEARLTCKIVSSALIVSKSAEHEELVRYVPLRGFGLDEIDEATDAIVTRSSSARSRANSVSESEKLAQRRCRTKVR